MSVLISIALVIWVLGATYFLFCVGLPILLSADCDHAFILLAPLCLVLPFIWPLALLWGVGRLAIEKLRGEAQ